MAKRLDRKGLRRKNVWKVIRTILQVLLLAFIVLWAIWAIETQPKPAVKQETAAETGIRQNADGTVTDKDGNVLKDAIGVNPVNGTAQYTVSARSVLPQTAVPAVQAPEGARFISVSYNGVNTSKKLESKIVNLENFCKQADENDNA